MSEIFLTYLPVDFPLEDVEVIGARLGSSGALIPGFIPPPVGLLDVRGVIYAQERQHRTLVVLPDRNLVSRMAQIAREGAPARRDKPSQLACDLMAYCQAMNLLIEPSIAFHELAHCVGNAAALEELAWFRAADRGAPESWIDLAQGRLARVELGKPETPPFQDLAFPLRRWRRNYIAALKLAELELAGGTPLSKALEYLQWMYADFMIAGPAAICGLFYLAPRMAHRSLMKRLRSPDREAALAGIRNAAWDITHLSDFIEKVGRSDAEKRRLLFATADEDLAGIAPALFSGLHDGETPALSSFLASKWPERDAMQLQAALQTFVENNDSPDRPRPTAGASFIDDRIKDGEHRVRSWRPSR